MVLQPLRPNGRVFDSVYESLRDAIMDGDLPAGTRLSVPALAQQLGTSRSPVREAVLRLTQDRLATEEPRRGAVVSHVGTAELADLYQVREVLEGLAARLAVEHADPAFRGILEKSHRRHVAAVERGDRQAHVELDLEFHQLMRQAGGNAEVGRMLDGIQAQVRLAMVTTTVTGGPDAALKDHEEILAAVLSGDAVEAETRARQHVARLRRAILQAGDAAAQVNG